MIPLAPEAQAVVKRYLAVAVGRRGQPITERTLLLHLHRACDFVTAARIEALGREPTPAEREALTVPRCGLHDLRRAFVTEAFRGGVALLTIAQWVGHADVRTTEGYLASYGADTQAVAPVPLALRR
jgi:integrase